MSPTSRSTLLHGIRNIPFNPAHWPFFYGWTILGLGTIGMVMSVPGQTVGVSVFTNFLIHALHLSRNFLSLAYLVGTISSALLLSFAGRMYDRFGARVVATLATAGLAGILFVLAISPQIAGAVDGVLPFLGSGVAAFLVMTVLFFLLRFFGQGVLTLASRNMVMEWFQQRRGLANAVLGVSTSFGFSYAPRVFESLIQHSDWQGAWRQIGLVVAIFAVVSLLAFRDTPEAHGLLPDGGVARGSRRRTHPETLPARSFTLREARRTYTFWVFALTLFLSALLMTAYTFNIVSIFAQAGMTAATAVSIFFPASILAVVLQFVGSTLSDYIKLKYLLIIQICGNIVAAGALVVFHSGAPVVLLIVGQGMRTGMYGIIANITWPRFFGREHLGAISGFAIALTVAGSAVGPYLFSLADSATGRYAPAALACLVFGVLLLVASFKADRPSTPG